MLLCEVALGDTMELNKASYIKKLPNDKHSVKGLGRCLFIHFFIIDLRLCSYGSSIEFSFFIELVFRTYPDPSEVHTLDGGVKVPIGKPVEDSKIKSDLLYNEYIVYDVAQVNIKYLFKMKFNFHH